VTTSKEIKKEVSKAYAGFLAGGDGCGCGCGCSSGEGYGAQVVGLLGKEAPSFGCGNPIALASLKPGEVVLDLGSGAGLDCFMAASAVGGVGPTGRVIGVDMTLEMVERARKNGKRLKLGNVEFRLGDIEALPVEDESVDVIISNCVINLAPDKDAVFREAYRVLKPGGRLMVSDIVLSRPASEAEYRDLALYAGCVSGSVTLGEYLGKVRSARFEEVRSEGEPDGEAGRFWFSASVWGRKSFGQAQDSLRSGPHLGERGSKGGRRSLS